MRPLWLIRHVPLLHHHSPNRRWLDVWRCPMPSSSLVIWTARGYHTARPSWTTTKNVRTVGQGGDSSDARSSHAISRGPCRQPYANLIPALLHARNQCRTLKSESYDPGRCIRIAKPIFIFYFGSLRLKRADKDYDDEGAFPFRVVKLSSLCYDFPLL
jgi:hypothetical protein